MPYSASALGVLPPLWSSAAKKPRPVLTFSNWVVFTLPYSGTREGWCTPRGAASRLSRGLGVGFDLGVVGLQLPGLHLLRLLHRVLDLRPHVGHRDHHQARLASVQVLAELLQVLAAHPGRRVTGHRAQHRAARGGSHEQAA